MSSCRGDSFLRLRGRPLAAYARRGAAIAAVACDGRAPTCGGAIVILRTDAGEAPAARVPEALADRAAHALPRRFSDGPAPGPLLPSTLRAFGAAPH